MLAAIRPAGKPEGLWVLPEGRRSTRARAARTAALREVDEETGAHGRSLGKLGDTRYWFNWDGERVFKVVSFFLVRYEGGRLGDISEEFRHEVADVRVAAARRGARRSSPTGASGRWPSRRSQCSRSGE